MKAKQYCKFVDEDYNKRSGLAVGSWFVVTFVIPDMGTMYNQDEWEFALFWKSSGKKVFENISFRTQDACERFGDCLIRWYGSYLLLHSAMPEHNVFQLVKWTINNGLFLAALFEVANTYETVLDSVEDMYKKYSQMATKRVQYYTNGVKNPTVDNYGVKVAELV